MADKARMAPPAKEGREWSASQVEKQAQKALTLALAYFRIPDHWEIHLQMSGGDEDAAAEVLMDHVYLRAVVCLNTEHLRSQPRRTWEVVGHEVAHISLAAYDVLWDSLPGKISEKKRDLYVRAMENTVVQLTRMWLRDNPDPEYPDGPVKT